TPPPRPHQCPAARPDPHHHPPEPPPPPNPPPPPLTPPLSELPPENPPPEPPPTQPPGPTPREEVIASANSVTKKAMMPLIVDSATDAAMNQNSAATRPPVASEPNSLPNRPRLQPPSTITATIRNR